MKYNSASSERTLPTFSLAIETADLHYSFSYPQAAEFEWLKYEKRLLSCDIRNISVTSVDIQMLAFTRTKKANDKGSFAAQTGLVDEVISSGKLSIIKDQELRNRLTSVSGILDNAEEDYEIRINYYMDEIIPYLTKYIPFVNKDQYMDFSSWSDAYKTKKLYESPFQAKYDEIDLLQLEYLISIHKLNNDFVNLN